jgi:hypothetical protein
MKQNKDSKKKYHSLKQNQKNFMKQNKNSKKKFHETK